LNPSDRPDILNIGTSDILSFPGLRPIKQAELSNDFRKYIPSEYQDEMCPQPSSEVLEIQKREQSIRGKRKLDLKRKNSILI
jgi:hypothetical protein